MSALLNEVTGDAEAVKRLIAALHVIDDLRKTPRRRTLSDAGVEGVCAGIRAFIARTKSAEADTPDPRDAIIAELRGALERLLSRAKLLFQNCEGCAVDHHGVDYATFGRPGWLSDADDVICDAESILESSQSTTGRTE